MSTTSDDFHPPATQEAYLGAFSSMAADNDAPGRLWAEVDKEVQRILASLDSAVGSQVASLRGMSGRTMGRAFQLFTYRTFSRADSMDIDPVVVGLTFSPAHGSSEEWVAIDADISGEQTGDHIAVLDRRTVRLVQEELLEAARDLALQLCQNSGRIVEALVDVSRST